LNYYFGWNVPWIIFSVLLTAGAVLMTLRGVAVSTKLAGFFFAFEMLVLVVVSVAVLIKNGGHLSTVPFQPDHITDRFRGLPAGSGCCHPGSGGWTRPARHPSTPCSSSPPSPGRSSASGCWVT